MKKLIVFASALALSVSMAFAMDEAAMDEEMMEAAAPSVSLSGAAELGFKHVDDDRTPDAENLFLIRKYQVNFSSQGTTDGGLAFGAGISIEDEQGIDNDANEVGGSNVYIGGADGSWKLKLGGNDPGIDVAGGIGVADDHFAGEDSNTIGLEGSVGTTSYRFTMADPQKKDAADGDWSAGASTSLGDVTVGFGMDSEDGLALNVGTDFQGVGVSLYWSQSEYGGDSGAITAPTIPDVIGANDAGTANVYGFKSHNQKNNGLGAKASMSAGEGATFSVAYSTLKSKYSSDLTFDTDTADTTAAVDQGSISREVETKEIEVAFSYDLGGGATFKASVVKNDMETTGSIDAGADGRFGDADDAGDADDEFSLADAKDKTTLKAVLAFSF